MSILSQAWKHNRNWLGNVAKNFAPVAGAVFGGPLGGALIGGLGSMAGRGIQEGANLGNILKQGASGASIAAGGHSVLNGLRGLFAPSSAGESGTFSAGGVSPEDLPGGGGGSTAGMPGMSPLSAGRGGVPSPVGAYKGYVPADADAGPSMLSRAAHSLDQHPMAAAMGLQGLGNLATAGSENAMRRAQTQQIQSETAASEEERKRRQRLEAALEPLRQALAGQLGAPRMSIPSDPYLA